MSKIDLSEAYNAVFGPEPENGPTKVGYNMGIYHIRDAVEYAEQLKRGQTIDSYGINCIQKALNLCISERHSAFPAETKTALRGIHNRFHQRYKREIHCLQRGLKQ